LLTCSALAAVRVVVLVVMVMLLLLELSAARSSGFFKESRAGLAETWR
jgi:hypothetical protein